MVWRMQLCFKTILSLCCWPDTWTCGDANVWATWAWRRCRCAVPRACAPSTSGSATWRTWGCAPSPAPAPLSGSWACAAASSSQTRGSRWWRMLVERYSILTFRYNRIFLDFFFYVRYSTLLHMPPPLRFHCVGGCWDRSQDTVATTALAVRRSLTMHSARSHPNIS